MKGRVSQAGGGEFVSKVEKKEVEVKKKTCSTAIGIPLTKIEHTYINRWDACVCMCVCRRGVQNEIGAQEERITSFLKQLL